MVVIKKKKDIKNTTKKLKKNETIKKKNTSKQATAKNNTIKDLEKELKHLDKKFAKNERHNKFSKMAERHQASKQQTSDETVHTDKKIDISYEDLTKMLKPLIKKAQSEGYITLVEISECLPPDIDDTVIEQALAIFEDRDLNVYMNDISDNAISTTEEDRLETGKNKHQNDNESYSNEQAKNLTTKKNSMDVYMQKIALNKPLSRSQELKTAMNIKQYNTLILHDLCLLPTMFNNLISLYNDLAENNILLRNVIDIDTISSVNKIVDENFYLDESSERKQNNLRINFQKTLQINNILSGINVDTNDNSNDDVEEDVADVDFKQLPYSVIEADWRPKILKSLSDISNLCSKVLNFYKHNIFVSDNDKKENENNIIKIQEMVSSIFLNQNFLKTTMEQVCKIYDSLSAKENDLFKIMKECGIDKQEFYDFINDEKLFNESIDVLSVLKTKPEWQKLLTERREEFFVVKSEIEDLIKKQIIIDSNKFKEIIRNIKKNNRIMQEERNKMILSNLRLVLFVAKKFINSSMSMSELIQEGNAGLIKAVDKFDYKRGFKFSTYATWWIKQSISRSIIEHGKPVRIPSHMTDVLSKKRYAERQLGLTIGRTPVLQEISRILCMDIKKMKKATKIISGTVSLDAPYGDGERSIGDFVGNFNRAPVAFALNDELKKTTSRILSTLSPREERILRQRFGINCPSATLEEIGKIYGVTRERIRQIEAKALNKMKNPSRSKDLLYYRNTDGKGSSNKDNNNDVDDE